MKKQEFAKTRKWCRPAFKWMTALLLLLIGTVSAKAAEQTAVAKWVFSTGYDVEKDGTTAIYTPNDLSYSALANTAWKTVQPFFRPNQCALTPEKCYVTVKTSDGKWEGKLSSSSYVLRLNTASIDKFTAKADYTDGSKHDHFFEVSLPTTSLTNVKVNFATAAARRHRSA